MKYLITGGLGFIGSNFILRKIEESSHEVLNYDKKTYAGNYANLKKVEKNKNYQFILGDISDFNLISDTIKNYRPDVIINFAAESHVDRSIDSADEFINTNVVGTVNMLKASMSYFELLNDKSGFKFMHISTDEVFGDLDANGFFKENSLYNPSSPYSASKASSDHFVRAWHKTYGLPILISNCSNNFGPFQFPEKLIPLMIIKCINRQSLPIYGDGKNIRDWIFVGDHCSAIDSILEKGNLGETYLIGANNEKTNLEIINFICNYFNNSSHNKDNFDYFSLIKYVKDRPGHDFRYAIDSSKLRNKLQWTPKYSFEKALETTIDWYINNKIWYEKVKI